LFTSDIESGAEENFMNAFRNQGGNEPGKEPVQLEVYLTHEKSMLKS